VCASAGNSGACLVPAIVQFLENEAGLLVHPDQKAAEEIADRQVFARFLAIRGGVSSGCAAALELLDGTFRGPRAVDCASLDALRP
jgi:hypothetical protein